jgi:hypothetical protein
MRLFSLSVLILVACCFFPANGQSSPEIWYPVPLHNAKDRTGGALCQGIDADLSKMAMEKRLGILKKLSFEKDTCFRRYFQQDSFSRDNQGFLDPLSIRSRLQQIHIPETKLLLVYDVTAQKSYSTWKPPAIIAVPNTGGAIGASILMDNLSSGSANNYDSIWCKISFMDFIEPSHSVNRSIVANEKTCHGDPVACIVETIQSIGRDANARSGKPDIQLSGSPRDQHWGKIVGGSLLAAGGIGLIALTGIMNPEIRPVGYIGGTAMVCTGAAFLTVGIIRQAKYRKSR